MEYTEPYSLDEIDTKIILSLQKDGRESFSELAKRLGIAVSTVSKRYANLVEVGILNVIGRVDPGKIGYNAYASILIKLESTYFLQEIASKMAVLPEVSFLAIRTGEFDLELNVMCKDNEHLLSFMEKNLHKTNGIKKTETNLYLRVIKWGQPELQLLTIPNN